MRGISKALGIGPTDPTGGLVARSPTLGKGIFAFGRQGCPNFGGHIAPMFGPLRFEPPESYCKSGVPCGPTFGHMLPNFVHTGATLCTPMPHVSNIRLRSRRARREARVGLWPLAAPRLGCGAFARDPDVDPRRLVTAG